MAGLFRSLFKGKKSKKEEVFDDIVFQPCSQKLQRQPTARFAELPATAAYHTRSAPKLRKGPQSCPGGYQDESLDEMQENQGRRGKKKRQDFSIDLEPHQSSRDRRYRSQYDLHSDSDENDESAERISMFERKSQFYLQKWEDSERQRREDRKVQEQLEKERNSIQNAMSNMAYCMASVQQMEQLKKERDQYRKEMSKYKSKCERLENKCEQLEAMSPNYGNFQNFHPLNFQPSPFHTPQFPPPLTFPAPPTNFMGGTMPLSLHRSTNFLGPSAHSNTLNMSNTPTTIGSDGAGESLINPADVTFLRPPFQNGQQNGTVFKAPTNFYDDDAEEIKNYRDEEDSPRPLSDFSQSTGATSHHV